MSTPFSKKQSIAIIGGGVAGMMLAAHLDNKLYDVAIYEKGKALGRKFLVAGDGGLNVTHSEPIEEFLKKYDPASPISNAVRHFTNTDLRNWLASIGIETYVGSSKRVFPLKETKPITVLNAILGELGKKQVTVFHQHTWMGWQEDELLFQTTNKPILVKADAFVFAMGGGSWSVTGSDGMWLEKFAQRGIPMYPLVPSNCAVRIEWPSPFLLQTEGQALKNISVSCGNVTKLGEAVITQFGLEGGAIYALGPQIRENLRVHGKAIICLDLKPTMTLDEIENRLQTDSHAHTTKKLENVLKLGKTQILLLKQMVNKEDFLDTKTLSYCIKNLPIEIIGLASLDEAISTVGGIPLAELNEQFEFKKLKRNYAIGEMLDWDAPTGGYLLQACFSMGVYLADCFNKKLNGND